MSNTPTSDAPASNSANQPDALDFKLIFESSPAQYVVVDTEFRVLAATDTWLGATLLKREEILGRTVFEILPENPGDPNPTGAKNWRDSMDRVLASRTLDLMPLQRYDIQRPAEAGGGFEERYWQPLNAPVFDATGQVTMIIHGADDVTEQVLKDGNDESMTTSPLA